LLDSSVVVSFQVSKVATSMASSGGAWGNVRKFFKAAQDPANAKGLKDNGVEYKDKKRHASHDEGVAGDTIGDTLKGTGGPTLNVCVKLIVIASRAYASVDFCTGAETLLSDVRCGRVAWRSFLMVKA
jgi:Na+/H+-translocating membrane pyrophosphatase